MSNSRPKDSKRGSIAIILNKSNLISIHEKPTGERYFTKFVHNSEKGVTLEPLSFICLNSDHPPEIVPYKDQTYFSAISVFIPAAIFIISTDGWGVPS
jgi:hypothetical protein